MAKNKVQFQKGTSLFDWIKDYGDEEKCRTQLFNLKWPNGFVCPECSSSSFCSLKTRKILQCNRCHHQTSLLSGTIFESTHLPLTQWFLAIHLITQAKTAISTMELMREIGVSYNTAWKVKHKLMQVMKERDDSKPISGLVQLDDAYWGGEQRGGKRGRGSSNKTPFVAAVSVNEKGHPIRMNFNVVKGFRLTEVSRWAKKHLTPESVVVTDGLACFSAVTDSGCTHHSIVTGGGPDCVELAEFTWVNTMIGNVKSSIHGTYHSVSKKHLPRYLAEFCYRFNRRFELSDFIQRLAFMAVRTPPMPYRLLKLAEESG